jgi:phage terminase large subunit-like protein
MALGLIVNPEKISKRTKTELSLNDVSEDSNFNFSEPIFCQYQINLINDESDVVVVEKGRQIGFSHTFGFKAVLDAISDIRDFIYTSYNLQACKEFIKDCVKWCRLFNLVFKTYEVETLDENSFCVFEIKFNNNRSIFAVAGDAKNFRGKPGCNILIDEAAYRDTSLEDILAAAMATLIHGGKVFIGSTHCGMENPFNILCEDIKKGKLNYSLHNVSFRDAIAQGLYKRICIRQKKTFTPESEKVFVDKIYDMYGIRASEELDAIPSDFTQEGKIFTGLKAFLGDYDKSYEWQFVRYHDLAATNKKLDEQNERKGNKKDLACYSASVKVGLHLPSNTIVVIEYTAEKLSPLEGDNKIIELAVSDGNNVVQLIEIEPGSSGIKYVEIMKNAIAKKGIHNVEGYAPKINKLTRAIPAANAGIQGELLIKEEIREDFNKIIKRFSAKPQPLVTDVTDCLTGCYNYIKNDLSYLY